MTDDLSDHIAKDELKDAIERGDALWFLLSRLSCAIQRTDITTVLADDVSAGLSKLVPSDIHSTQPPIPQ